MAFFTGETPVPLFLKQGRRDACPTLAARSAALPAKTKKDGLADFAGPSLQAARTQ